MAAERRAWLADDADATPDVTAALAGTRGPVIAATDYARAVPELPDALPCRATPPIHTVFAGRAADAARPAGHAPRMRYTGSACVDRISLSTMNDLTCRTPGR